MNPQSLPKSHIRKDTIAGYPNAHTQTMLMASKRTMPLALLGSLQRLTNRRQSDAFPNRIATNEYNCSVIARSQIRTIIGCLSALTIVTICKIIVGLQLPIPIAQLNNVQSHTLLTVRQPMMLLVLRISIHPARTRRYTGAFHNSIAVKECNCLVQKQLHLLQTTTGTLIASPTQMVADSCKLPIWIFMCHINLNLELIFTMERMKPNTTYIGVVIPVSSQANSSAVSKILVPAICLH